MKPRLVSVSDTATGEDDFSHVVVLLGEDPTRDDDHEGLIGQSRENAVKAL